MRRPESKSLTGENTADGDMRCCGHEAAYTDTDTDTQSFTHTHNIQRHGCATRAEAREARPRPRRGRATQEPGSRPASRRPGRPIGGEAERPPTADADRKAPRLGPNPHTHQRVAGELPNTAKASPPNAPKLCLRLGTALNTASSPHPRRDTAAS